MTARGNFGYWYCNKFNQIKQSILNKSLLLQWINYLLCLYFISVIDEDLKVWEDKGGISKEDIESAKPRGAHYQIINHKLYRENDCMFPAR